MISTTSTFIFFVLPGKYSFRKPVLRISFSMMKLVNILFSLVMNILPLSIYFLDNDIPLMASQSNEGTSVHLKLFCYL